MTQFEQLYHKVLQDMAKGIRTQDIETHYETLFDKTQLDCLLHPKQHAVIWRTKDCECEDDQKNECQKQCLFQARSLDNSGNICIDEDNCVGCTRCLDYCKHQALVASKDACAVLEVLHGSENPCYALIAPAFLGQFTDKVTPGKLRSALKKMGFDGMIEVSLFADILTLKEALEFRDNIVKENDYQLTSCCCPIWISMIRKIYHELIPHVPGSVSPMIAAGRCVKQIHSDAITVFIGPCIAKKAEAKERDICDAVDYVLTFQEMQEIFTVLNIDPVKMPESEKDHSSRAGRIYARTGGVSEAVSETLKELLPSSHIPIKSRQADGVLGCKAMIADILEGKIEANFYEGMGCVGGCVGGPKAVLPLEEGTKQVNRYGDAAPYQTPLQNYHVLALLHQLGFETIKSLTEESQTFTRHL